MNQAISSLGNYRGIVIVYEFIYGYCRGEIKRVYIARVNGEVWGWAGIEGWPWGRQ